MNTFTASYLRQKRKRLFEQLQKIETFMLRGSLIERYKQCGKSNCHCANGKGHGPTYYLSVSLPGQRPLMIYVASEYKTNIEASLSNYREAQHILEKISAINRELLLRKTMF